MKSLRFPFFLLLTSLLLLHLAPAEVAAQGRLSQKIQPLGDLLIFHSPTGGLWRTDGTAAGTFRLAPTCSTNDWCEPIVGRVGHRLFFLVEVPELVAPHDDPRHQLWATDGTLEGTYQLAHFPKGLPGFFWSENHPYSDGGYLVAPDLGLLFFRGITPETGAELWVSDGTPAGTRLVDELATGPADGIGRLLGVAGDRVLFVGITPRRGAELWRTDGTLTGTRLLRDFLPGTASSHPRVLTTIDGRLFFTFTARELAHELWVSDGTSTGTELLYGLAQPPPELDWGVHWVRGVAADSLAYLLTRDVEGSESLTSQYLVRSDGTPGGTYPLRNSASILNPFESRFSVGNGKRLEQVEDALVAREAPHEHRHRLREQGMAGAAHEIR